MRPDEIAPQMEESSDGGGTLDGVLGVLRFDVGKHREQFLTACHAKDWREVVEEIEYVLAKMEYTPAYGASAKVIRELIEQLRLLCRDRGIQTELMEEDRKDAEALEKRNKLPG